MTSFKYPEAIDPEMIGEYPTVVAAGAGYFYDEVLEYRVWCYVHDGAKDEADGDDYYYVFENFSDADEFYNKTKGAQKPFALIKQYEWINEYEPGKHRHEKGERIAEWRAENLEGRKRQPDSIKNFFKDKT